MRTAATALATLLAWSAFAQEPKYTTTIEVVRYLIHVRVVDSAGGAITDLSPADFEVTIEGERAHVESATWIGRVERAEPRPESEEEPAGRLFVLLVQTDFGRDAERMRGQLAFNLLADRILDSLDPQDRVAVFSHDSHLKLRLDFTLDRAAARKAVRDSMRIERLPLPPASESGPSLVPHLDNGELRKANHPEQALLLIARALRAVDGEKTIIFAGWGMGTMFARTVSLAPEWAEAVELLQKDRVAVFSVGTGVEGTLSRGMANTAQATGGFHASSRQFPHQSVTRIRGILAGTYELFLRLDEPLRPGLHGVETRLARRKGTAFGPTHLAIDAESGVPTALLEVPETAFVAPTAEEGAADLFLSALRALQNGESDRAESLLTDLIGTGIAPPDAWYERGMLVAARGDLTSAAADLREYLQRMPRGAHAGEARELLRTWQP